MKHSLSVIAAVSLVACARGTTTSSSIPVAPSPAPASAPASMPAVAPPTAQATANVADISGGKLGTVTFSDTPAGLLVSGSLSGLGLGPHGIHLHAVGVCEAPFTSAGGHFNPSAAKHGFRSPAGHHAGDMPNIITPAAGVHSFQFIVTGVHLTGSGGLLDADGAAVVVHSGADDYITDPAGGSGARLACGVITLTK